MKKRLKENIWHTKEHILRTKLIPFFGKRKMCDIQPKDVIAWQNEMLEGSTKTGKPYSPVYLKTLNNQLSAVFNYAVKFYGLPNREMLFWTQEEYKHFAEELCTCVCDEKHKNGMRVRNSLTGALRQQGLTGEGISNTITMAWVEQEKEHIGQLMLEHGIEWVKLGTHEKHKSVSKYKAESSVRRSKQPRQSLTVFVRNWLRLLRRK